MKDLIFEIRDSEEGGFYARALGQAIFTQADTWEDLKHNIREALGAHFDSPEQQPKFVTLHYVKDDGLHP